MAAIPGADGAGLTLLEEGHSDTIVASAPFVAEVDAIQYSIEEGPCITAAHEARTVRSGELSRDEQWPKFGPRVGRLGVHSVLSLPLVTPAGVVGAMNVYAHPQNAFDDHAAVIGELFAVPAAIAVQNAQVLAQTKRLAHQLQAALTSRAVIDQALGILMSRTGSTSNRRSTGCATGARPTTSSCAMSLSASSTRPFVEPGLGTPPELGPPLAAAVSPDPGCVEADRPGSAEPRRVRHHRRDRLGAATRRAPRPAQIPARSVHRALG